jgi:cation transport ATPase
VRPDEEDRESGVSPDNGSGSQEDRQLSVAMMFVGVAMMFVGFLDVFLSISGGFELAGVTPLLLYFAGVALWAQATVANLTLRYVIMGVAIVLALAIFHYGEVLFWHKQVVFWGTIAAVIFFMFKTAPPTR